MALISGTRLGPYEILAPIGAGRVVKAFDLRCRRSGNKIEFVPFDKLIRRLI